MGSHASLRRHSSGWVVGAAGGLAVGALFLLWQAVLAQSACPRPEREARAEGHATMDADNPSVEQRVVVSLDPEVIPPGIAADAVVLTVLREPDPVVAMETPSPIQTYIIDDDTNLVLPRVGRQELNGNGYFGPSLPAVALSCVPGERCQRAFRIRFVWADPSATGTYRLAWRLRVQVTYPRAIAPCSPPSGGEFSVATDEPVVGNGLARSALPATDATGELNARHVTIRRASTGPEAPGPTSVLRVAVARPNSPSYGWRGWIRVVEDGSARPLIESELGRPGEGGRPDTIDLPVLIDCDPAEPCERGYWIILQSFSAEPPRADNTFRPPAIETISWSASVLSWGLGTAGAGLSVEHDDPDDGLARLTTLNVSVQGIEIPRSDAARAVDVTLTVTRPEPTGGLDPTVAGMMLVPLFVDGANVTTSLAGDGATLLTTRFLGRGFGYLIGHPMDACAAVRVGDTCAMTFRLIVDVAPQEQAVSTRDGASVEWALRIHGVPPGTSYVIGAPVTLPRPWNPLDLVPIATVLAVGVLGVWIARRRRSEGTS